ncbi:hypothetical protein [Burkholderia ubonensis]|uniref:hypothetical protein n=1 Tax=Burkholderia ubonensis TaxID=101571 RepID=UPI0012FA6438|nr:hypothetical protein [Burkholderia ubonensis]
MYISSDADESREPVFLPDGANSPLVLGAQQVVGAVAVEGAVPAGLALFGLAAACLLGGALAASLIGNKDDGVSSGGGDGGGGGGRPAKLAIGDIWDMLRSRCRTHRSSRDMHAWIERLAPPTADVPLRAQGADHSTRYDAVWFPLDVDPLTGGRVVRVVQPALDGGDVFAMFVRDVPVALLRETLDAHRLTGELMVLARHGRVVVHSEGLATQADTSLVRRGLDAGTWRRGLDGLNVGYRDGMFTISHRERGTDWVLASFRSWRTMAGAPAREWLVHGGLAFGVLAVLWALLIAFDREVLRPLLERSSRVFEIEGLNRTIAALAPVGIGLFSLRDGNRAARERRDAAVS